MCPALLFICRFYSSFLWRVYTKCHKHSSLRSIIVVALVVVAILRKRKEESKSEHVLLFSTHRNCTLMSSSALCRRSISAWMIFPASRNPQNVEWTRVISLAAAAAVLYLLKIFIYITIRIYFLVTFKHNTFIVLTIVFSRACTHTTPHTQTHTWHSTQHNLFIFIVISMCMRHVSLCLCACARLFPLVLLCFRFSSCAFFSLCVWARA